jgi:hypothetical protein
VVQKSLIGYIPEQWYRAEIRVGMGWAEVYVDEQMILGAEDPDISGGRVGLYAAGSGEAMFDDVRVAEASFYSENFRGAGSTWRSWDFLGGDWRLAEGSDARGLEFSAGAAGGLGVFGSRRWGNYTARAEILPRSGRVGMVYHYRDAANYSGFCYDANAGALELISCRRARVSVLARREVRLAPRMHSFEVTLDRGLARARVDGVHELSAWETGGGPGGGLAEPGRVGLGAWGGRGLARSITVQLSGDIEPLASINPIFATDREMLGWSSWHGDWAQKKVGVGNDAKVIRWHRARFSGDVTLLVEVAKFTAPQSELALSVAKTGSQRNNGYILKMIRPVPAALQAAIEKLGAGALPRQADKAPAAQDPVGRRAALVLTRNGRMVAGSLFPEGQKVWTLALRRAGPFLLGYVNSHQVLFYSDDRPLTGRKVAWYSRGVQVEEDGFRVYSPTVLDYAFSKAPSDWRVASGIWAVTNRWQCDPRWSFFSGFSLSYQEAPLTAAERNLSAERRLQAALWSKRTYGENVVVEFFAGIKMHRKRGPRYSYARDINCTLSADGKDLSSGYSFLFGGFDNDHSAILRKGQEVKRTPSREGCRIPQGGNIHHRWFHIRAERRGSRLRFSVDGGRDVDLEYEDPQPLPGGRVAIWTWDCGIMISRVRISGAPASGMEPLDFIPGKSCASPYPHD